MPKCSRPCWYQLSYLAFLEFSKVEDLLISLTQPQHRAKTRPPFLPTWSGSCKPNLPPTATTKIRQGSMKINLSFHCVFWSPIVVGATNLKVPVFLWLSQSTHQQCAIFSAEMLSGFKVVCAADFKSQLPQRARLRGVGVGRTESTDAFASLSCFFFTPAWWSQAYQCTRRHLLRFTLS